METRYGTKLHNFYGPVVPDLKAKKSLEWDLNDWKWDGDLFTAAPVNPVPSDCRSRQFLTVGSDTPLTHVASNSFSSEMVMENDRENRDLEKRRRVVIDVENEECVGSLHLKLGDVDKSEASKSVEKSKVSPNNTICQVEGCEVDLSSGKDYHRRHKVCDAHSKATKALVGNVMQRFCQQCSRFHVLEEFDEGKRSCRRRLAGHNKRRRKTHPENVVNNAANVNDEGGSNYLLITLLRILANVHSNSSDQTKDQDLLSHLLRNLANRAGTTTNQRNTARLLSPVLQNVGTSTGTPLKDPNTPVGHTPASDLTTKANNSVKANDVIERTKLSNIDLNSVYVEDSQMSQNSGNSGSTSSQSPSTSSGEAQSRTDQIVFKLFGKDPSDFPLVLRKQILDWLSNSPTDIESYIRPGCVVLTIYLRMNESKWEELCCDLTYRLRQLLDSSTDSFWRTGWIYTRVRNQVTFVYDGQVVVDTPLPLKNHESFRISSIKPVAVSISESVQFIVKGFNLSSPSSRLLCTIDGKYIAQENCSDTTEGAYSFPEPNEIQSISFSCITPNIAGRGFIEVEDHCLNSSSSFFPFLVADKDVCIEICTLESIIENTKNPEAKNRALEFIHEMGWLLHKAHLKFKMGENKSFDMNLFSFKRFKWLVEFSVDRDWCAVVKKLLNIIFDGTVDSGQHGSILLALMEIGILHQAVRRNCRSMVEFLIEYRPNGALDEEGRYLFRPDAVGPGGLTPLHVAACSDGCENVLDALTDDPGSVGIASWKTVRDSTGLTPHDYACFRGHYSYIHLVQRKLDKKSRKGHVILDIGNDSKNHKMTKLGSLETEQNVVRGASEGQCRQCETKLCYGSYKASLRIYRPAMLSMVAIAAVCVCAALLFKSSPEVLYSFRPFRWELLEYGSE